MNDVGTDNRNSAILRRMRPSNAIDGEEFGERRFQTGSKQGCCGATGSCNKQLKTEFNCLISLVFLTSRNLKQHDPMGPRIRSSALTLTVAPRLD